MLEVITLPVGLLETNCYLVFDPEDAILRVIDPGAEAGRVIEAAKGFDAKHIELLLTHGHVDHISAAYQVAEALGVKTAFLAAADHRLYRSKENNLAPYVPAAEKLPEVTSELDDPAVTLLELPGHTPGSVGFLFAAAKKLFVGDTVFAGAVGRTDLPGGSYTMLCASLKQVFLPLADDIEVYPGHGPATTVGRERATNPYLKEL
ncbi:MAG: MBL fold metallo-hydrolase [Victivallaceae bacterium]|nr:MBL fold metallo-hydrolase [Victivallaceae bacterium]